MEISLVKGYYMSVPKHFIYTHINPHGIGTILISILPVRPKEEKDLPKMTEKVREKLGLQSGSGLGLLYSTTLLSPGIGYTWKF